MRTPRTVVLSPAAPLRLAHALAWLLLSLFLSVASAQESLGELFLKDECVGDELFERVCERFFRGAFSTRFGRRGRCLGGRLSRGAE